MDRTLLNAAQVAARLHRPLSWFRKNRERLMREHGFPGHVAGIPNRWDPGALAAWLDAQIASRAAAPGTGDDEVTRWQRRWEAGIFGSDNGGLTPPAEAA